MRNFRSVIIGGLLAIAIFTIFNCAGYLMVSFVGPIVFDRDSQVTDSSAALPQADVVTFSTPTDTPALRTSMTATHVPVITPVPLLPTVTPGPPTSTTIPQTAPGLSATATPLPQNLAPQEVPGVQEGAPTIQLQVLSHQSYIDDLDWFHIVGEVQNDSDVPLEYVQVIAKLYDAAGENIGTKLTFTAPNVVYPGGKAPFDIVALRKSQWEKIEKYTLDVTGDIATRLLNENMILINQNSWIDNGVLYVRGEVQNTGETPALVKLVITLYDANQNVINTNWSYADAGIISVGDTSTFRVKIDHKTDPNNYSYRIQIVEEPVEGEK